MSLSSIKHLRDNESMFTRTKNLQISESTYLDSAPQRQTQARIKPLGEKRYFESTQQSEKGLRSTLTEIHKSRAQTQTMNFNKRPKANLQESLNHPTLTQFLQNGEMLQKSDSNDKRLQRKIFESYQTSVYSNAKRPLQSQIKRDRQCRSLLSTHAKEAPDVYQIGTHTIKKIHSNSSGSPGREPSAHSSQPNFMDDASYIPDSQPETAIAKAQRQRRHSTNVRIRTGGQLHKFRDTMQAKMQRKLANQFRQYSEKLQYSENSQLTKMHDIFGERRETMVEQKDQTEPQISQENKALDHVNKKHKSVNGTSSTKPKANKSKKTQREKTMYKNIINEERQYHDARIMIYKQLLNTAVVIPASFGQPTEEEEEEGGEERKKFVKGVNYMQAGDYVEAIKLLYSGQQLQGETESMKSESLSQDDSETDDQGHKN